MRLEYLCFRKLFPDRSHGLLSFGHANSGSEKQKTPQRVERINSHDTKETFSSVHVHKISQESVVGYDKSGTSCAHQGLSPRVVNTHSHRCEPETQVINEPSRTLAKVALLPHLKLSAEVDFRSL